MSDKISYHDQLYYFSFINILRKILWLIGRFMVLFCLLSFFIKFLKEKKSTITTKSLKWINDKATKLHVLSQWFDITSEWKETVYQHTAYLFFSKFCVKPEKNISNDNSEELNNCHFKRIMPILAFFKTNVIGAQPNIYWS